MAIVLSMAINNSVCSTFNWALYSMNQNNKKKERKREEEKEIKKEERRRNDIKIIKLNGYVIILLNKPSLNIRHLL